MANQSGNTGGSRRKDTDQGDLAGMDDSEERDIGRKGAETKSSDRAPAAGNRGGSGSGGNGGGRSGGTKGGNR